MNRSGPEQTAPALFSSLRLRLPEVPVNLLGFVGLSLYMAVTGAVPPDLSLFVTLGAFSIWTETALLERRTQLFAQALKRKARPDDTRAFTGAVAGVIASAMLPFAPGLARGLAFPLGMLAGTFLATLVPALDWRRSALSAILVVYNGTGGAILRTAMTLAVLGNVIRTHPH